jgi:hypothetical protein
MKYYCIEPATKDKEGVCVLPTMQEPVKNHYDFNRDTAIAHSLEMNNWKNHLASLPKFPTSCDRKGWFEGREQYQENFFQEKGKDRVWQDCDKWEFNMTSDEYRRKFIVPQSEEKEQGEIFCVSDTPGPIIRKNKGYRLDTPTDLRGFARMCWPLIYGSLRDAQENAPHPNIDYLSEVYRISFKIMTGEDSKHIPSEELPEEKDLAQEEKDGIVDRLESASEYQNDFVYGASVPNDSGPVVSHPSTKGNSDGHKLELHCFGSMTEEQLVVTVMGAIKEAYPDSQTAMFPLK